MTVFPRRTHAIVMLLLALSCTSPSPLLSLVLPKREVRAVWIATAAGLDWPHSLDRAEQESSLRQMVAGLKAAHFNTIFFQVRARGDAYYRSSFDPWAENLTGTFGKDPGWDPLATLLETAHRCGMEVHAWFNVYKIRTGSPAVTPPRYPAALPRWTVPYQREAWLDPGIPAVREYLEDVALELIRRYDIDGINFDYARYPGRDFYDAETYRRYAGGAPRDLWRRHNVTAFITEMYDRATALKPMLKVGSSPLGIYDDAPDETGSNTTYFQAARDWIAAEKQDYLSPQLYWGLQTPPGRPNFEQLVHDWQAHACGRQIYAGVGAYRPEVSRELGPQIDTARECGVAGEAFFRYENIEQTGLLDNRYATLADIPPMPWKDSVGLAAPATLVVTEVSAGVFQLEWTPPSAASDGDLPRYYNIYRWPSPEIPFNDPRSLIAITSDNQNAFVDTVGVPAGLTAYYAVTAFDKGNNESPPSNVENGVIKELLTLRKKLVSFTSLTAAIQRHAGKPSFVSYKLAGKTRVSLSISLIKEDGSDSLWARLVDGTQEGGTYVVGLGAERFRPGRYLVRLSTAENTIEQPIELPR